MVQKVPPSRGHIGRPTTAAAARRAGQRLAFAIDNPGGDVIDDNKTPTGGIVTDPDAATITFDMTFYRKHQVTLGGNRTLAVANVNVPVNQIFFIKLIQDGSGSRTVTWWSGIRWAGGAAPTLTTTPNKWDWFIFVTTGAGTYDGFIPGQNG